MDSLKMTRSKMGSLASGCAMAYHGCLKTNCVNEYQIELSVLLMHECLTRVSSGNVEIEDGMSSGELFTMISAALGNSCAERGRWADLAGIRSLQLNQAIKMKASLTSTSHIGYALGEALEARGFYSKAAAIYAEAGRYLHDAAHPRAVTALCSAGLAWKRHGDFHKAESFYALSLQSLLHFEHDSVEYNAGAFNTHTP